MEVWVGGCQAHPHAKQPHYEGMMCISRLVLLDKWSAFTTEETGTSWELQAGRCTMIEG